MNTPITPAPIICYGESGWDIVSGIQFPGGLSIALPFHLRKLGLSAVPVTRIGIDDGGKNLIRFMEQHSIATEYFQLDYELMTGKTIRSEYLGSIQHELPRGAAWDKIVWDPAFANLFTENCRLVYSTVAARDLLSRHTLFQMLEAVSTRILLLGLRSPYYIKTVVEQCLKGAWLVQLSPEELELVTGWFAGYSTIDDRIRALQDRFRIPLIVVTEGHNGGLLNADGNLYRQSGFITETAESTGCSDAFLAGLLYGLFLHQPNQQALEYGCALGHLVSGLPGACPAYEMEAIGELITKNNIL